MRGTVSILLFTLLAVGAPAQDTLRICTYNVLDFPNSLGSERIPYFITVINGLDPDVLVCQEMMSTAGAEQFLQDVLDPLEWSRSQYVTQGDNDVELYFKSDLFTLQAIHTIETELRNFEIYELASLNGTNRPILYVASSHLKASSGVENEQRRLAEVQSFRAYLNANPLPGNNLLLGGDLNLYSSAEPAYQALLEDSCFIDPLNAPGEWHNNSGFAGIHTQSTRITEFGGGSTGGLDDRFDFILTTPELADSTDWDYCAASYTAYGNDGEHFNQAINVPPNAVVSAEIAAALHYASDHLPVYVDLVYLGETGIKPKLPATNPDYSVVVLYPNPFNQQFHVSLALPNPGVVQLDLMDVQGRKLATWNYDDLPSGSHDLVFDASDLASGLYFLHVTLPNQIHTLSKVVLVK
ncbi:MAG: T9SS type A sorting domain-containing protein [bacterium]